MSFLPEIPYATGQHRSERLLSPEGEPFAFTPDSAPSSRNWPSHYPAEQRKSTVLYALFMVQEQIGYVSRNGMRHVAEVIGCTPAEVEDVATYYAMFYKQPTGKFVSRCAGRSRARSRAPNASPRR